MTNKMVTLDPTTGAESLTDVPLTGSISESFTAGEAWDATPIAKLIYIDPADGKAYLASTASKPARGFALADGVESSPVTIYFTGLATGLTLTAGDEYFLGTSGAVSATPGSGVIQQRVGFASTATELLFHPFTEITN
jgi:hypothetical protein